MNKHAIDSQGNLFVNYSNLVQSKVSRDFNILLKIFWPIYSHFTAQKKIKLTQKQALKFTATLHEPLC